MNFKKIYNLICENKDQEIVLVYPGRFQPPSLNHLNTLYAAITDMLKYINDNTLDHLNVIISTSDSHKEDKSPFDFAAKKEIWQTHLENNPYKFKQDVPTTIIYNIVKNPKPYDIYNLIENGPNSANYAKLDTKAVVIVGESDKSRFKDNDYFIPFTNDVSNLNSYKDNSYIWIIDDVTKIKVDGNDIILRGHIVRQMLKDAIKAGDTEYQQAFKLVFGWYDEDIAKSVKGILS